jgi:prevent-host-death family protein
MNSVGSTEAKAHLPRLLERVVRGERILITKHGQPMAMLVPPPGENNKDMKQIVKEMLELRDCDGPALGGKTTIRELIEEGRRF